MNQELKAFLSLQTKVSAAFNFFINGMIAALIYHKADVVPTDTVSLAIDLFLTCLLVFSISTPFCKANLKGTKTEGILASGNKLISHLNRLFRHPVLFCLLNALVFAVVLFVLMAPVFALLGLNTISFGAYMVFKTVYTTLLGGGVTLLELYVGMHKAVIKK